MLGALVATLEPLVATLGTLLAKLGLIVATQGQLGALLATLGALLAQLEALVATLGLLVATHAQLRAMLAMLGAPVATLGTLVATQAQLGGSRASHAGGPGSHSGLHSSHQCPAWSPGSHTGSPGSHRVTPATLSPSEVAKHWLLVAKLQERDKRGHQSSVGGWSMPVAPSPPPSTMVFSFVVKAAAPTVYPLVPCDCDDEAKVSMACLAADFFPQPATISWTGASSGKQDTFPVLPVRGSYYALISQYTVSADQVDGGTFQCKVTHSSTGTTTKTIEGYGKLPLGLVSSPPNPTPPSPDKPAVTITLLPPSLEDLYLNQNGSVTCVATNLKDPEDVKFVWQRDQGEVSDVTRGTPQQLENGLYRLTSTLKICAEEWNSGETFSCTVQTPQLEEPVTKTIKKELGRSLPPHTLPHIRPHRVEGSCPLEKSTGRVYWKKVVCWKGLAYWESLLDEAGQLGEPTGRT
uniref:Ig-like domain-containing protein n=1 Tax=Calidris pygmaea TaxID=425635 RepID=A0A8C3JBS3_9CHAR